jgi:hypothetical protein
MKQIIGVCSLCVLFAAGCASTSEPGVEKGLNGTIAYLVEVSSSEPGAVIEANNEYVGKTPVVLKIFGDKDGTFHNFGSYSYYVTAHPPGGGLPQTKEFRTGGWFTPEDMIPKKIYFDFVPAARDAGKTADER